MPQPVPTTKSLSLSRYDVKCFSRYFLLIAGRTVPRTEDCAQIRFIGIKQLKDIDLCQILAALSSWLYTVGILSGVDVDRWVCFT